MAWNQPGSDNQDPWGQGNGQQGPPDLDQVIRDLRRMLGALFGGRGGGGSGSSGSGGRSSKITRLAISSSSL